jgi:putative restriction endonuclease
LKFDAWMRSTGLSESSVLKYFGAIEGSLTDWATEAELIQGSILDISSKAEFDSLSIRIKELAIFKERNNTGHSMYSSALNKFSEFLSAAKPPEIESDIAAIISNPSISTTEKAQLINARIGQGQFRKDLLQYWGKCAITGFKNTSLLVASHIKPWSQSNNIERLDKFNGLLLTPNLDRAFDQGLITFSNTGSIVISPLLEEAKILGITESMSLQLTGNHQYYMEYHREHVFQKS